MTSSVPIVPPLPPGLTKKDIEILMEACIKFYPLELLGDSYTGYRVSSWGPWQKSSQFFKDVTEITGQENIKNAYFVLDHWKKIAPENLPESLSETIPYNLEDLVEEAERAKNEKEKQAVRQNLDQLLETLKQKRAVATPSAPLASPKEQDISQKERVEEAVSFPQKTAVEAVPPLTRFAGKILSFPFKLAVYFSGPTVYSSEARDEGPAVATARYLLAHGIDSSSLLNWFSLESKGQSLGLTLSQIEKLVSLIREEEKKHPSSYKWILLSLAGQKAGLTQSQIEIVSLLSPSLDGSVAILPRKSLLGSFVGRIGQQLFGKISSKILKTVAKKTVSVAAGTEAGALLGGPVGAIVGAVVSFVLTKLKNLVSKIFTAIFGKKKEGNLAIFLGAVFLVSGLVLGAPVVILPGLLTFVGGLYLRSAGGFSSTTSTLEQLGQAAIAGLVNVALPAIATPIIVSLLAIPVVVTLILFIINSGAYLVPPKTSLVPGIIESPYIDVVKTAEPEGPFDNNQLQPLEVKYSVKIKAKKGSLTNVRVGYSCTVIKDGPSPNCPKPEGFPTEDEIPKTISPTEDGFVFSYKHRYDKQFSDSFVADTITVTADVAEKKDVKASTSLRIKIGKPPEDCPAGWPAFGSLTQGAYTNSSHRNAEAIDISTTTGTPVKATHTGVVRAFGDFGPYGKHVEVESSCGGVVFFSRYAHLSVVSVQTGQVVKLGDVIGLSGNTGNSSAPHLHYEFRYPFGPTKYPDNPPYMMPPYVEKALPRGCVGITVCKTQIP